MHIFPIGIFCWYVACDHLIQDESVISVQVATLQLEISHLELGLIVGAFANIRLTNVAIYVSGFVVGTCCHVNDAWIAWSLGYLLFVKESLSFLLPSPTSTVLSSSIRRR